MGSRFRRNQRVRLSDEGRAKLVASLAMQGIVLSVSGPLVTVKEDGFSGQKNDYHEDYLEVVLTRRKR